MYKQKAHSFGTIFFLLIALILTNTAYSQNDDVEIEVPTVKNAIGVRPLAAIFGFYGISYERYIAKRFSVYGYLEVSDGPKLFSSNVNTWVKNSMNVDGANVYYSGYGGAIGVRRYFEDKKYSLVGNKDLGSLVGWFVGAYIPWRKMKINVQATSTEHNPNVIFPLLIGGQTGSYTFDGHIYGLGVEGGKHWVFEKFSLEVNAGFTYMQGIPSNAAFNYTYPLFGDDYQVNKSLGLIHFYGTFAPKIEVVMGIAF